MTIDLESLSNQGECSDVVSKEMFCLESRSGDKLALRPEGTAGICRLVLGANNGALVHELPHRFFYSGPMFRYERPQKGRQRQFSQFGVECFGEGSPYIDAELIIMAARVLRSLEISPFPSLLINSLGSSTDRERYHDVIQNELLLRKQELSEESQSRLERVAW